MTVPAQYDVPGTRGPKAVIPRPVDPHPPRFSVDTPPPPPEPKFAFTYAGMNGPVVKRFASEDAFLGYVEFWQANVSPVSWLSASIARGTL